MDVYLWIHNVSVVRWDGWLHIFTVQLLIMVRRYRGTSLVCFGCSSCWFINAIDPTTSHPAGSLMPLIQQYFWLKACRHNNRWYDEGLLHASKLALAAKPKRAQTASICSSIDCSSFISLVGLLIGWCLLLCTYSKPRTVIVSYSVKCAYCNGRKSNATWSDFLTRLENQMPFVDV